MQITIENLSYIYSPGTPFERTALKDINISIPSGSFVGLIGHTGSGKSTLIQQLNGLIKPTKGKIYLDDFEITKEKVSLVDVRKKVGLVFQYPEYQLFEENVHKDVAFGPKNLGLSTEEIDTRVKEAIETVGLDYDYVANRSPFDLSGGQRRRVAIAGVLAMKPEILILDEPTAGLDPKGRDEILGNIKALHDKYKKTIILVSHSMEDVGRLAEKLIVLNKGQIAFYDEPGNIFREANTLESIGLGVPQVTYLMRALKAKGHSVDEGIFTIAEAKKEIMRLLGGIKNA